MKISIITPSLNQGEFIERTIKSITQQKSKFELEYIIIDAQSVDNTLDIIESYAQVDKRIKYTSEPDNGQSHAINKGLKLATGNIVAWLNSDDEYQASAFEKVYEIFSSHKDVLWLYGQADIVNIKNDKIFSFISSYKKMMSKNFSHSHLLIENFIAQPAVFFRRDLLEKVGYLDESLEFAMDYDLWLRFSNHSKPFIVNSTLANFRLYDQSKTGANYRETFHVELEVVKKYTNNKLILFLHYVQIYRNIFAYDLIYFSIFLLKKTKIVLHRFFSSLL